MITAFYELEGQAPVWCRRKLMKEQTLQESKDDKRKGKRTEIEGDHRAKPRFENPKHKPRRHQTGEIKTCGLSTRQKSEHRSIAYRKP